MFVLNRLPGADRCPGKSYVINTCGKEASVLGRCAVVRVRPYESTQWPSDSAERFVGWGSALRIADDALAVGVGLSFTDWGP